MRTHEVNGVVFEGQCPRISTKQRRTFDWPFLVLATWLGLFFLWRGRVGRVEGTLLLAAYAVYLGLHVVLR